ncbi:NADP-dependent 3-hydroxy acid dehydrogenase YdfG [Paenarthrobacter nicotinovorans]|uniref:hypothetical protein n=1 Tax=Micrococcaceae TaxID=1268 RepID=UPI0020C8B141|nr:MULTISPECIES: hypothetical protein [Micrococcaceae]MDR6438683.1 NADP-dependent 3-hydroxy acid dehydrogenase YdfG [Paenarthrobacter nicotinovorans]
MHYRFVIDAHTLPGENMTELTCDLTGKNAFVTGGCAGMGASSVRAFAEADANVAIVDPATAQ